MTHPERNTPGVGEPCAPLPPETWRPKQMARVSPEQLGSDGTWSMPAGSGPCRTWPLEPGCGCLAPGDPKASWGGAATWTPDQQRAVELATEMLWRATAGRFGLCSEIVRPCVSCSCDGCSGGVPRPELHDGQWFNVFCGQCDASITRCGCATISTIKLPGRVYWEPIVEQPDWNSVHRPPPKTPDLNANGPRYRLIVWIDGHVLLEPGWPLEWEPGMTELPTPWTPARGDYWLVNGNELQRMDGKSWPLTQDLSAPIQAPVEYPGSAVGAFAVQYWRGQPVPPGGRRAVSVLACEMWRACHEPKKCRLPAHVQSISRQGVNYEFVDTTDYAAEGRIGLPEVDSWIGMVNPHHQRSPSGVWTPDLPAHQSDWTSGGRTGS